MSWGSTNNQAQKQQSGLTKETQALLNDAMKQRGLSMRAMQDVSASVKRGDSNWADHLNSSTASFKQPESKTNAMKVPKFTGRHHDLHILSGPPASFSGKRMTTTPAERDMWSGSAPGPDREAEKDRLSRVMEVGAKELKAMERREAEASQAAATRAARSRPVDAKEELINQVVAEIRERREFLEEMKAAGKSGQYEATIKGEIAARLKELERLGLDVKSSRPQLH